MTISSSELKKNMTLIIDGELYQVVEWQHRKPPKAPPQSPESISLPKPKCVVTIRAYINPGK